MEVHSCESSRSMAERMNAVMAEGMEIVGVWQLPEGAKPAMAVVAAADYVLTPEQELWGEIRGTAETFFAQSAIPVRKKTKKSEKEVDIRPLIYDWRLLDGGIFVKLASGSTDNLKPELILEAFFRYMGREYDPCSCSVCRMELYAREGGEAEGRLIPLSDFGEEIL